MSISNFVISLPLNDEELLEKRVKENWWAREYFNIKADLVAYTKALGNGFPVAAIGGCSDKSCLLLYF